MKNLLYTSLIIALPIGGYFLGKQNSSSLYTLEQIQDYKTITVEQANTMFLNYYTRAEVMTKPPAGMLFSKAFLKKVLNQFSGTANSYVRFYYVNDNINKGLIALEVMPDGTDKTDKILLYTGASGFEEARVCPNACDLNSPVIQGADIR